LAAGEGAVWAASESKGALLRIDPARNAVVAKLDVAPPGEAVAGQGAVWLSYPNENMVSRLDPATNSVTKRIHVGPRPEGIAVSPGAVWVANAGGPSLSRIDPATNRVVATVSLGPRRMCCSEHMSLVASSRAVWVAVPNGNRIVHVDPATNRIVGIANTDYSPCGWLVATETGLWSAAGDCGDVVTRIDARTNKPTARLPESSPSALELAYGSVWVAASGSGNVDQIDPRTGLLVARLHIVGLIKRLAVDFGSVWVTDDFGRVLRIKPQR
jgi:YVTN family beta-propeller protein